jgi:hypothetical protein
MAASRRSTRAPLSVPPAQANSLLAPQKTINRASRQMAETLHGPSRPGGRRPMAGKGADRADCRRNAPMARLRRLRSFGEL